ncbi:hscarg dehydrogenase [Penicillium subrubescens]|uniref:hscarg dehydrogenase n=1 Tax=Penicillium subrubescens TaxID=1316194 RepID=UPI0025452A63|nr:hscarg dehydrogenase [Penicillium subrubescens]KAJ5910830.1 hscarg dehydrogenase [Penicillium subrubescens]
MQGSGVIDALAKNPDWKIRGLPRNTNSEKAKALVNRGIEMVAANLDDEKSLIEAFNGVNAVFAVRDFYESFVTGIGPEKAMEIDTLPAASDLTNSEAKVPHFDAKGAIEAYIKKDPVLNAKTIVLLTGFYASNFNYPPFTPIYLFWESAEPPRMWGTVGEGDVMIDSRDLEGVKNRLVSAEDAWRRAGWSQC